jgi:hypothetical protein
MLVRFPEKERSTTKTLATSGIARRVIKSEVGGCRVPRIGIAVVY